MLVQWCLSKINLNTRLELKISPFESLTIIQLPIFLIDLAYMISVKLMFGVFTNPLRAQQKHCPIAQD